MHFIWQIVAVILCFVQASFSAFSYVWHRRHMISTLEGKGKIYNKLIAMGCLLVAAVIMIYCTSILPLAIYNVLTNSNMVLVTVFAYYILGEKINKYQVGTLISIIVSSVMSVVAVNPRLSSEGAPDSEIQEKLGIESLHSTGTIVFLSIVTTFQLMCIYAMYRQQYRVSERAKIMLEGVDEHSLRDIDLTTQRRQSTVLRGIFRNSSQPTAEIILRYLGYKSNFIEGFAFYFYLVLAVHLVSFHPSIHGAMIKFAIPIFTRSVSENCWINWFCLFVLPISWGMWLIFTGWLVTCFDANLVTPLVYASQSLYGVVFGIIVMQEKPEWPLIFGCSVVWMILSIAMFAACRDKEDDDSVKVISESVSENKIVEDENL